MSSLQSYIGQFLFVRVLVMRQLQLGHIHYVKVTLGPEQSIPSLRTWHNTQMAKEEIRRVAVVKDMCERIFTQMVIATTILEELKSLKTQDLQRDSLADGLLVVSRALRCFEMVPEQSSLLEKKKIRSLALAYLHKVMQLGIELTKYAFGPNDDEITYFWEEDIKSTQFKEFRFDTRETYMKLQVPDPTLEMVIIPAHCMPVRFAFSSSKPPAVFQSAHPGRQRILKNAALTVPRVEPEQPSPTLTTELSTC